MAHSVRVLRPESEEQLRMRTNKCTRGRSFWHRRTSDTDTRVGSPHNVTWKGVITQGRERGICEEGKSPLRQDMEGGEVMCFP